MAEVRVMPALCRMCDDRCPILVTLENGKVREVGPRPGHPWNDGRMCSKGHAAADMVNHPDRLLRPLKREGGSWKEIALETALDEIAGRLSAIRATDGARAVSVWKGEALGFAQQEDIYRRFIRVFGSPNYFSNDTTCFVGRYMGARINFGVSGAADFENARCIVIWGSNPPASHPHMTRRIMSARRKGARLIAVDPRLSMIARQADIHAALLPGTDGCLALGLARLLIRGGHYDREFIGSHAKGFEDFAAYADRFTPEVVAAETGLDPVTVESIAREIARSAPAVSIYAGNGTEHHPNGVQSVRAISLLDALTGAFDRPGGKLWLETPGLDKLYEYDDRPLRELGPIGADQFPAAFAWRQECNTILGMDAILSGRPYSIKAMILAGANPVATNPNAAKVRAALGGLDLLVVRDLFMTDTARLAHYVLPAASFLERTEVHTHGLYQSLSVSEAVFRLPGVQTEYEFLRDLAARLGMKEHFSWEDDFALTRWLLAPSRLDPQEVAACPAGFRYAARRYEKWRGEPLPTQSGKVEFRAAFLEKYGYPGLPEYISVRNPASPEAAFPMTMISGSRIPLYYHSRFHNIARFREAFPAPFVEIHPEDADGYGIVTGDMVEITSRTGVVRAAAQVTAPGEIVRGCVGMTHGWPEANVNEITPDDVLDPIDGFPQMKSVPVALRRLPDEVKRNERK